jgi:hypothetical protein
MVLNRNPDNFFAENEQVAFCPAIIVPGMQELRQAYVSKPSASWDISSSARFWSTCAAGTPMLADKS